MAAVKATDARRTRAATARSVPAVGFPVKLAFESVVDRLDQPAQWLEGAGA